jgi:tetratricopeptide (TPR) repeat protein
MIIGISILLVSLAAVPVQDASASRTTASTPGTASRFDQLSQAAARARDDDRADDAVQLYKQALALRPNWKEGLWNLGRLLYSKNQFAESRDVLRRFVAFDPEPGLAWALLGMSEFQTRDYSRSFDHLERATAQGVGDRKDIASPSSIWSRRCKPGSSSTTRVWFCFLRW